MADDQSKTNGESSEPTDQANPNISPAPTDVAGDAVDQNDPNRPPPPGEDAPSVAADALPDGTVPTVLTTGQTRSKGKESHGKATLSSVYRRADILTTLLTFAAAIVVALLILGAYWYFTVGNKKPAPTPKVTSLTKEDLTKLNTFFSGNNTGTSSQVLTVSSPALFNGRVAIASDLKVVGTVTVSGVTSLTDLVVDKSTTLGATNIRGNLNVTGPTQLQGPALLNAGASINGNMTVSGNGSFGGSLSAGLLNIKDLSVSGTLYLAGHLAISGNPPSVAPASEAGSGASAQIDGNDSAGTVTINTGNVPPTIGTGGLLVTVTFRTPYAKVPKVIITPIGLSAGKIEYYVLKTANTFIIGTVNNPTSSTSYSFDYWVVQ